MRAFWVILSATLSIFILLSLLSLIFSETGNNFLLINEIIPHLQNASKTNGFWTLLILIISSPVAFIIWYFRDKNAIQRIENARKDTNLKEFQKLAEWVSGAHLIEDKIIEKTITQNSKIKTYLKNTSREIIREYTDIPKDLSIPTYSKKDGAVGLQISAVYNLLPFYRGEYGESFKKPALNLLTSAWLSLQQKELEALAKSTDYIDKKLIIFQIQQNAKSTLGIAITRVLLSLNSQKKLCLLEHEEILPNLILAGMDFYLAGLDDKVLHLFQAKFDYSGINLTGSKLKKVNLKKAKFRKANLQGTNLQFANLQFSNLEFADLQGARLERAKLQEANLQVANLKRSILMYANLQKANIQCSNLQNAIFDSADLQDANLQDADLLNTEFQNANLKNTNFTNAKFLETVDFTGAKNIDKAIGLPAEIVEKYKTKTEN